MNLCLSRVFVALLMASPALLVAARVPDAPPAQAAMHESHDTSAVQDPAAVPEVRWASDAPLREGMRRVRAATEALSHGAHGPLDVAQVHAIASELEAAVRDMIARCQLPPEPDAGLHPLLARVLQASATLAAGAFDADALAKLEAALARYPALFEDAQWSASRSDGQSGQHGVQPATVGGGVHAMRPCSRPSGWCARATKYMKPNVTSAAT